MNGQAVITDDLIYELHQEEQVILTGDQYTIREKIEELLEEKVGMFVSLQEFTDDGEYEFYLHSDNDEDLTDEQLRILDEEYGINTHDPDSSEFIMKKLLNIQVKEKAHADEAL